MHLKCYSPGNASRHMQATCVHTQACTHMQAHVLTCVNCKRTARGKHTCALFYMYTLHTCTKHGRQSRPPTRDHRHPHRKPTRLEPHFLPNFFQGSMFVLNCFHRSPGLDIISSCCRLFFTIRCQYFDPLGFLGVTSLPK